MIWPTFTHYLIGLKQSLGYFIDKIDSAFLGNLQLIFGLEYLIRRNLASSFFMHEEKKINFFEMQILKDFSWLFQFERNKIFKCYS